MTSEGDHTQSSRGTIPQHDYLSSPDVNFLDLDLNLLIALDALLRERSVTNAAALLHRSQPALSASLKRLRHQFKDDLLIRVGNRYELTPLATQLERQVAVLMADLERLFATRARFDADRAVREFTVLAIDYGHHTLGRAIRTQLAEVAPHVRLRFVTPTDDMIDNAADAVRGVDGLVFPLGYLQNLPHLEVFTDRWMLLVDRENSLVGDTISLDALADLEWVAAYHQQGSLVPAVRQLQLLGVDINVTVTIDGFASLPAFVRGTETIALIQEGLARQIAPPDQFRLLECPFDAPPLVETFWWHPALTHDPGHTWFRSIVERAGRRLEAEIRS